VYVVGGQHTLNAKDVSKEIWSLDVSNLSKFGAWKAEPVSPWQHARILPVVAACGDDLFVASGADLVADQDGTSRRVNRSDAWLLKAGKKWERLPDSPVPIVGAPSLCDGHGSIFVFGGDDGQSASWLQPSDAAVQSARFAMDLGSNSSAQSGDDGRNPLEQPVRDRGRRTSARASLGPRYCAFHRQLGTVNPGRISPG
jgi:hypothetical protein